MPIAGLAGHPDLRGGRRAPSTAPRRAEHQLVQAPPPLRPQHGAPLNTRANFALHDGVFVFVEIRLFVRPARVRTSLGPARRMCCTAAGSLAGRPSSVSDGSEKPGEQAHRPENRRRCSALAAIMARLLRLPAQSASASPGRFHRVKGESPLKSVVLAGKSRLAAFNASGSIRALVRSSEAELMADSLTLAGVGFLPDWLVRCSSALLQLDSAHICPKGRTQHCRGERRDFRYGRSADGRGRRSGNARAITRDSLVPVPVPGSPGVTVSDFHHASGAKGTGRSSSSSPRDRAFPDDKLFTHRQVDAAVPAQPSRC